jgi:UDP-glucose 4-epimerase
MGMTKAIQERVFTSANLTCPDTRFVCVRYGNVLASRGSVIPLFHEQIRSGGPITITTTDMTRFLLSLEEAVDTVFAAIRGGRRGETYIPRVPSAKVTDVARALIGERGIDTIVTGIRPGEKVHEILISEEECHRSVERGRFYAIRPVLPELHEGSEPIAALPGEFSSANEVMSYGDVVGLLTRQHLMLAEVEPAGDGVELLR